MGAQQAKFVVFMSPGDTEDFPKYEPMRLAKVRGQMEYEALSFRTLLLLHVI